MCGGKKIKTIWEPKGFINVHRRWNHHNFCDKQQWWKMESKKVEMPDMSAALTARDGGATDVEIMIVKQLTEMIENSVKELKVTILWKTGEKDLEYSVTTYLVNHDAASLPTGPGGGAQGGSQTGGQTTGTTGKTGP